jgi:hypothetical protein
LNSFQPELVARFSVTCDVPGSSVLPGGHKTVLFSRGEDAVRFAANNTLNGNPCAARVLAERQR